MACLDCWELSELGPPPNLIEFLPPPPLPTFLQRAPAIDSILQQIKGSNISSSPCSDRLCDHWRLGAGNVLGIGSSLGQGAVLSHPGEWGNGSPVGDGEMTDTWLLILIGCSIAVLLLGAVLAVFLFRCREVFQLAHRQHHQAAKTTISRTQTTRIVHYPQHPPKLPRGAATVLHPADSRSMWASLTPHGGTQHYISGNYPQGYMDYGLPTAVDNTYATIEHHIPTVTNATTILAPVINFKTTSFNNSRFYDHNYGVPTPLIDSYHPNDIENHGRNPYAEVVIGNVHPINTLGSLPRPRISSPTRIEHPNLPPLNLHPNSVGLRGNGNTNGTLRRGSTFGK